MANVQIATKLTIAGMGLSKEVLQKLLADKEEGETVVIARMIGKTSKVVTKPSKLDPTRDDVCFHGDFEGLNLLTGEVFNAPKAYLPGAAEQSARNAVETCGEGESVVFGCEVAVKKSKTSAVGYVFGVSIPRQPQAQDPLAEIRAQMGGTPTAPALPAPEVAPEDSEPAAPKSKGKGK